MPSSSSVTAAGFAVGAVAALSTTASASPAWRLHDPHVLGTHLDVVVAVADVRLARRAGNAIFREIRRLDAVFNTHRPESELSRLNRSDSTAVSPDLFQVLWNAERWRRASGGGFDGRLGEALRLWSEACDEAPSNASLGRVRAASAAQPILDATTRVVTRPPGVTFALDAIAKGYIVDAALAAGRQASPEITGLAVSIGGDLRCWGASPDSGGWRVGVADTDQVFYNAPIAAVARLTDKAIATSGRGPRDWRIAGYSVSCTVDPATGRPVETVISATAAADTAMDADALATACMALTPAEGMELADRASGSAVRIVDERGQVHASAGWSSLDEASPGSLIRTAAAPGLPAALRWPADWRLRIDYFAPSRQAVRDVYFRTPYLAVWVSDLENRPVRTILLIGQGREWHRDNFIWWGTNRANAERFVDLRSRSTTSGGRYLMFWDGIDDDWNPVPVGRYILHVESSQERGKHSHRQVPIVIGDTPFEDGLSPTLEGGSLSVTFNHFR